jgi:hypothetical protein
MPTNQIGQNWPIDKFVVIFKKPNSSIQDFVLAVIRHDDGTVWGADINNVFMTLGPVTQFRRHSGGSIGNGAADKFMVAFRHESDTWEHLDGSPLLHRRSGRLAVFLTDGRAFFNEIVDL